MDIVKEILEMFIDDFLVFRELFEACLRNAERVLERCEKTNLVLN